MRKLRKALALLLVFTFLMSALAACGKKKEDQPASNDQNKQTEEDKKDTPNDTQQTDDNQGDDAQGGGDNNQAAADDWSWPLPEKKEISIWLAWSNEYLNSPDELLAIKKIEENTNVHVKWVTVIGQEASEKFGLLMASGDYPDILRGAEGYYTGGLVQACNDGVIYDLTEAVPQYMPHYQALRESNEKLSKDTVTDDGRMVGVYTVASNNGVVQGERVWGGMCIRQDWLDELNLPVPVTIDDWHTTLKAFKDNYNCEAPLLIAKDTAYDSMHHFLSAYGVLGEFYNDNGTVKYGPLEDGYKQWVQLFRDWYAEGLIDPNFISNDAALVPSAEYMGTGRAGASNNIWGMTADTYKIQGYNSEENFFLTGVTTPVLNEGDTAQIGFATSELTKETLCVTTNCKDLEFACRYLDYWYTEECMFLDSLGIEGESYVADGDGTYTMTDSLKEQVTNGSFPTLSAALSQYTLVTSDFGLYNWAMFDPMYEGMRTLEAYNAWNESQFDLMLPPCMTMTEEETTAYNNKYTSIQTLVRENTIKFITGGRSLDEYDNFVQDLYNYGIEDCIGYKQAALDRYNAR